MRFFDDELNDIYDRTSGYCHICHKKVAFRNYGKVGRRGAWEVEHSKPRARGGSNRKNNLYPACIGCNRQKGVVPSRTARARSGKKRAPLSTGHRERAKRENAIAGGFVGSLLGGAVAGPGGAVLGGLVGAHLSHNKNPDE